MAIQVSCSKCGEDYRVKDEAAGKTFKCKSCGTTIRIPEADDDDFDEEDEIEDELPPPRRRVRDDDDEDDRPKRRKKRSSGGSRTLGPAIGLYVTGALWLIYCAVSGAVQLLNPNAAAKPPPGADQAYVIGHAVGFYGVLIGFPLLTLLVLFGAFCLQTRRLYPMALLGCIIASIPCCSPGCVLGMPFGIWGLVVLFDESVKQSFD